MPLVRLQIRNELGLADPALYRSAPDGDPKSVLDGVGVAGLVGILRQLGDLAEFAADVFRDTLEQVEATTSRCNKIRSRVKNIESALIPIEKAIKVQTSHLHFAYTSGSSWHSKVRTKHKHLNHSGLPKFMMDTYAQCRGPPHLSLLDRFDSAGGGACLKRYSDPSYFKKVHMGLSKVEKDKKRRKSCHGKKRRSQRKFGVDSESVSIVGHHVGARLQFTSFDFEMATSRSTMASESDPSSYLSAFGSGKHILCSDNLLKSVKDEQHQLPTSLRKTNCVENNSSALEDQIQINEHYALQKKLLLGEANLRPSSVSWDEDVETSTSNVQRSEEDFGNGPVPLESMPTECDLSKLNVITANLGMFDQDDIVFDVVNMPESFSHAGCLDEIIMKEEYFIECIKPLNSPTQMDTQCQTKQKFDMQSAINIERVDIAYGGTVQTSNLFSDSSQEDSCVQSYGCSDKEPCPALVQVEPIEKVHVQASQIFPAVLDTIGLRDICEENGDQIKEEIELNGDVKAEEVGTADGLTVKMGDQLRDSVSEESCNLHGSSFDEGSSPAPYQIQHVEKLHLEVTQMPPLVLDMVSTRDFSKDEIECQTKQEVGLLSTLKDEDVENADKFTVQMGNQFNDFPSEVSSIQFDNSLVDRETSPASCLNNPVEKTHVEVKETTPHGVGTSSLRDFGEGEIEYQTKHEIELDGDVKDEEVGTADGLTVQMGDWLRDSPSEDSCIFPDNPLDNEFSLASFHIQPVELVHVEITQIPSLGINILSARNAGEDEIECQTKLEVELLRNVIAKEVENGDGLTVCMGDQFRESLCESSSIQTDSCVGKESSAPSYPIQSLEKIHVEANQTSSLALNTSSLADSGKGGTECQTKREVELPSNIKAEGVEIADKIVVPMNNMFTDFLNEELSILHGSSLDKKSSPASCQIQPLEEIHVEISQTPSPGLAMVTTIDFGEVEIEYHTKQEVKLQDDVRPDEVENTDGHTVEMCDQLTDALSEEFPTLYDSSVDKELSPASCLVQPSENIHVEVCHLSTLGLHMGNSKAFCEKEIECQTKREVETADGVMVQMGDLCTDSLEGTSILSGSSLDNESSPASCQFQPADNIHVQFSQGSPLGLDALGSKDYGEEETDCQTKREVETQTDIKEEIVESTDKCTIQIGHLCADSPYEDFSVLSHSSLGKEYTPASSSIEKTHLDIVQASSLGLYRVSSRDSGEGNVEFQIKQEVEFKSDIKAERFETVDCLDVQMGDLFTSSLNSESSISSYSCLGEGSSPAPCMMPPVENIHPEGILTSFSLGKVGLRDCSGNEKEVVCPTKPEVELQSYIKVGKVETAGDQTEFLSINSTSLSYCSLDKEASSAPCPIPQEDAKTMQTSFQDLDTVSSRDSSNCFNSSGPSKSGEFSLRGSSKHSDCLGSSTGGDFSSRDSNECDILGFSTREDFKSASRPPSSSVPADLEMHRIADYLCHTENDSKASGFPECTIWTNGGLLGLEPSKPPDLSGPYDATNKNHKKADTAVSEEQAIKLEEVNPYVVFGTYAHSEPRQTSLERPSSFSGFSNMFLKNASWGKASVTDNNSCESSVASVNALQEEPLRDRPDKIRSECTFPALHDAAVEDKFGLPSPSLEHMEISFHSVSGSETYQMKLKFFCESPVNSQEGRFPSFRLLPDHSGTRHAIDSDSEDTFCRSSQYMSDDALSECSDLSSEQWDYKECSGSKDDEIYDVLRSAPSSSLEVDVRDLVEASCDSQGLIA